MQYYVLDVNPEPWRVGPLSLVKRNGSLHPTIGRDKQLTSYKEAIRDALVEANAKPVEGNVRLEFFFWRRIESFETTEGKGRRHSNKPDVTNLQKATEDACQGVLFENDRVVTDIHSVMVQAASHIQGAVVIGIEGDNGLNLLDRLGSVVMERIRQLNQNIPAESDLSWGADDDIF